MDIQKQLEKYADREKAIHHQKFFKTGKGEYGEGDMFLGIKVPFQRQIAKKNVNATLIEIKTLLKSKYHEHRLTGLLILTYKYEKFPDMREQIVSFYLKNLKSVNNWDLVDSSAHKILGHYLWQKDTSILYELAESDDLWENRIAIISCFYFIKKDSFTDVLNIINKLLQHPHDLIHKANGWMLREIGLRSEDTLRNFLFEKMGDIPRTTLRYAIEKLEEKERKYFLNLKP